MEYHEGIKRAVIAQMGMEGISSLLEVAETAGIKRQTLSRFLNCEGGTIRTLRRIAKAVNSTPGNLLTLAENIVANAAAKEGAA